MSWAPQATPARQARDRAQNDALAEKVRVDKFMEFREACEEGDPTGCHSLGEWFSVVSRDYDKAAELYRENCEKRQHGASCFNLGVLHVNGRGVPFQREAAQARFEQACKYKHMDGCYYAALSCLSVFADPSKKIDSAPTKPNPLTHEAAAAAVRYLKTGCDAEHPKCCAYLGALKVMGSEAVGVAKDAQAALPLLTVACERSDASACRNLAVLYRNGDTGVPANPDLAAHYTATTQALMKAEAMQAGRAAPRR